MALVGPTGSGRKSAAINAIVAAWEHLEEGFRESSQHCAGVSSGEGLISALADAWTDISGQYKEAVEDKRLFIELHELGGLFAVAGRRGSTLADVMKPAFDGSPLQLMVKGNRQRASGHHISFFACTTPEHVQHELRGVHCARIADRFSNRFLWALVHQSKDIPIFKEEAHRILNAAVQPVMARVKAALQLARGEQGRVVQWSAAAGDMWDSWYRTRDRESPLGGFIGRAEAHVLRLSLIYALVDSSLEIMPEHLEAALAVWDYCRASAEINFEEFALPATATAPKHRGVPRPDFGGLARICPNPSPAAGG